MRRILAARDIAALYRAVKDEGVTQRQIAELTGQSQSEVSEILRGRTVLSYDLLVHIAEGLRIPRKLMGLSHGEHGAYGEEDTVARPRRGGGDAAPTPAISTRQGSRGAGARPHPAIS